MKTMVLNKWLVILSVLTLGLGISSCEKESIVPEDKLPAVSQQYINTHFENAKIVQVVKDVDGLNLTYEVFLEAGFQLEFSRSGEVLSVKSNRKEAIPDTTVPAKILDYVQTNYANELIWEWEKDGNFQEIQLSNGLELIFSKAGDFIKIDS